MSIQEVNPVPAAPKSFTLRPLLIGLAAALIIGALLILGLSKGGATGGVNALVLAPLVFLAGIVSFLSPCTLPVLPAYFAFTFQAQRERIVLTTVAFFLGLATTNVVLGASATALSGLLFKNIAQITLVGGIIVIIFGVMSVLGKGFSGAKLLDRPTTTVAGSYLYGLTFALGWTACIGPILGSVYTLLAATQGIVVVQGAILGFVYALGLGTPLILMATFFSRLGSGSRFWRIARGRGFELKLGVTTLYLHSTSILSGLLLILVGTLLATGQLTVLSQWSQSTPLGQWAVSLEQGIQRMFLGR